MVKLPESDLSEQIVIRVLHVDEEEDQLKLTKKSLEQLDNGIQVKSESSPYAALKELEHRKYDCVILDYKMPELNGFEFAHRIKEKHHITVILYTGQGSEEVAEKAFATGMDDYIRKEATASHYQLLAKRIRDAVEKKRVENLYRKSELRYRTLVNLAPDGIATIDTKGVVTFANPSLAQLTGNKEDDLVGKWFPKMGTMRLSDMPKFLRIFADIIRGKVPQPIEFVYVRKDGSEGWGEAHINLVKLEGENTEILAILRDITERKHLIGELEKKSEYFETQAEEKTRQLLTSERMSAAGAIAAQLGHDLRGPLSTVMNATWLLEHHPEKIGSTLPLIKKAVDDATQMLNEMRLRTQEVSLNRSEVELDAFITLFIDELVVPGNVVVERRLESQTRVSIDTMKMKRVLSNLVVNAFDAMSKGGKLVISTKVEDERVLIDVRDNGSGIPDDVKRKLFTPFFTSKSNGSGLGLSFCKRMVEAHLGEISVESKLGSGTSFLLKLPRVIPEQNTGGQEMVIKKVRSQH